VSAHASALLRALREAGDDGLLEADVVRLGGRYWKQVLNRLCRWHPVGEERGRFYLVGVEGTGGPDTSAGGGKAPSRILGSTGALSTGGQLALEIPRPGYYDLDRAA
jgi:hypothetical protein